MTEQTDRSSGTVLLELRLRADQRMPSEARHATDEVLGSLDDGTRQSILLIVTELVTNAVLHGDAPASLRLLRAGELLRIEVGDSNRTPPVLRDPAPDQQNGRGMLLISAMADDWGVSETPDGKIVWAELRP
ncbi:ATP-binding protein [Prauserella cavernicola]|uniref:ATP-binding protein n=1 Tax=Prauserella cavernicola TaxID=2800127 RepID=A0A934QS00_9PSEU|nr:ATP-binding protein [Prauserella cavernicola]MBK1785601.1 ATP-binding protein [Prauserella cavernicola]